MSVDAKIIFGLLLTRAFNNERPNEVWVGQEKIALITGIGLTKTKALIKLLCSRGFLHIEKKSGFSGRHSSYRIASLKEVYGHGLMSLEKWSDVGTMNGHARVCASGPPYDHE